MSKMATQNFDDFILSIEWIGKLDLLISHTKSDLSSYQFAYYLTIPITSRDQTQ